MKLAEILGQAAAISLLLRGLRSGRLPHALLFQGPEQVGKGTTARALAAALLCERGGEDSCGECSSCAKAAGGAHPDLLVVRRASKKLRPDELPPMSDPADHDERDVELRPFIRVDQIRELARHAAYAPREAACRVFIIDPADRMNEAAQNALLKTLEEPPGQSFLVLIAARPHLLLPTVRSRCLAVRFPAMAVDELATRLESTGMPASEARARASLSAGRPGRAFSLDLEATLRRREEILGLLEAFSDGDAALAELSDAAGLLAGRGEAELLEGLAILEGLLRDAGRLASGSADPAPGPPGARSSKLADTVGARRLFELVEAVERVRADLRFNLNRTLAAETLLAAIAGGPLP